MPIVLAAVKPEKGSCPDAILRPLMPPAQPNLWVAAGLAHPAAAEAAPVVITSRGF